MFHHPPGGREGQHREEWEDTSRSSPSLQRVVVDCVCCQWCCLCEQRDPPTTGAVVCNQKNKLGLLGCHQTCPLWALQSLPTGQRGGRWVF